MRVASIYFTQLSLVINAQVQAVILLLECLVISLYTIYQETLMKGKFDEFDESWPNCQTKTIQYKPTIYF